MEIDGIYVQNYGDIYVGSTDANDIFIANITTFDDGNKRWYLCRNKEGKTVKQVNEDYVIFIAYKYK
jgi:hypothetical protein